MATHSQPQAKRNMPLLDEGKRARVFQRMELIRETIFRENQCDSFLVRIARSVADGDQRGLLKAYNAHPVSEKELRDASWSGHRAAQRLIAGLAAFRYNCLPDMIDDKEFTPEEISEYRTLKARFIRSLLSSHHSIVEEIPSTLRLTLSALNILPDAVTGKAGADAFSSKMAWLGGEVAAPSRPGKIVLALSGGSAKGMFYIGFVRALRENGLWPDMVIGDSAGAMAAGGLASGLPSEVFEDRFSPLSMKRIFSPLSAPLTLITSGGSAIIGRKYGDLLKDAFGDSPFSDNADCFVVTAIHRPTPFGKAIIGRSSARNGSISLSSDIPLYAGIWGSSAMQGIVPHPLMKRFTAERLERDRFGTSVHTMELPYATLDDGGVSENLPLETSELLLEKAGEDGLIILVNLANLGPAKAVVPPTEGGGMLTRAERWFKGVLDNSAPMRAYDAFNMTFDTNVRRAVETSSGKGMKILLNPNNDGTLDSIGLLNFRGADAIIEYGYAEGKRLCGLLLGNS